MPEETPAVETVVEITPEITPAVEVTPEVEPTSEPEVDFNAPYLNENDLLELDQYDIPEIKETKPDGLTELYAKLDALEKKLQTPAENYEDDEDDGRTKKSKSKIDMLLEKIELQEQRHRQAEFQQKEDRIETVNQKVMQNYVSKRVSEALKKSFDTSSPAGIYASNFILGDLVNMVESHEANTGRLITPKETQRICEQHWKKHAPAIVTTYRTRAQGGGTPNSTSPSETTGTPKQTQEQITVSKELATLSTKIDELYNLPINERQARKQEIQELSTKAKELITKQKALQK
jgi:hypothetical protein